LHRSRQNHKRHCGTRRPTQAAWRIWDNVRSQFLHAILALRVREIGKV